MLDCLNYNAKCASGRPYFFPSTTHLGLRLHEYVALLDQYKHMNSYCYALRWEGRIWNSHNVASHHSGPGLRQLARFLVSILALVRNLAENRMECLGLVRQNRATWESRQNQASIRNIGKIKEKFDKILIFEIWQRIVWMPREFIGLVRQNRATWKSRQNRASIRNISTSHIRIR